MNPLIKNLEKEVNTGGNCMRFSLIEKNKEAILEKYHFQKIETIIRLKDLKFKSKISKTDMKDELQITSNIVNEGNESNANSKNIIKQYLENYNPKIDKKKYKSIVEVIGNIKSIINFCENKKIFLIYFTINFWRYLLNYYNEPKMDNIYICFELREIFTKYHDLVIKVLEKNDNISYIKREVRNYFERDEFAFILDRIIRTINNDQEVNYIEKLIFVTQYNPY